MSDFGSLHVTAYTHASNTMGTLDWKVPYALHVRGVCIRSNGLEHGYDIISELAYSVPLYPLAEKRWRQFNVACCSSLHSLVHMSALEIDTVHCFARMPSMFCKQSREKVLR